MTALLSVTVWPLVMLTESRITSAPGVPTVSPVMVSVPPVRVRAAAAAAAAGRIAPAATDYMLAAHVSAEPASIWLLDLIGVTPAIQAGLRLGEGTGALAMFPLLDMALSIYRDMDTQKFQNQNNKHGKSIWKNILQKEKI